ncbi:hypothetical protein QBC40DRAFT_274690 [Triangularia verruculosa]|uniref:Rhodopsin domain-containing protein n=1 Tax=Triangularia verruculosa TaxID=2587418 RepID=A0AAN6XN00_9PEZI|nr:hypothetical protein QBC40DRAFT_274690 [Triangularia verruculosa]
MVSADASGHADLANTPAAAPPPGVKPNFIDPPSQQVAMITMVTIMSFFTLIFLSLRLYTSLRITRLSGMEDWLCLLATVFIFTYSGTVLSLSHLSRHMWDVPVIVFTENYWKIRFSANTFQALAYFTSRLPILLLYLRLFGRTKGFRIACYFGIAGAVGAYLTTIPLLSYFCTPPIGGDWNSLDVFAKCKKLLPWAIVQACLDIVLNVYVFVLPLPVILKLQMPPRKKLGVLVIFLTGLIAVVCSAVGLYYRYQLSFTPDVNWNEGAFIIMSIVECNVAIICSCMPALASFSRHVFKDSSFLISIRSAFSRYGSSAGSKGVSAKAKFSDAPSSHPGVEDGRRLVPGFNMAPGDKSYIELTEAQSNDNMQQWKAGAWSGPEVNRHNNSQHSHSGGIVRTVAIDVV